MEVYGPHEWGTPSLSRESCCAVGTLPASPLMTVTLPGLWAQRWVCWFPVPFPAGQVLGLLLSTPVVSHETEKLPSTSTVVRCSRRDWAADTQTAWPFLFPYCPHASKEYSDTIEMHSVMQPAYNYANVCSFSLTQCPVFFQLLFWKFSTSCGSAI